MDVRLERKKGYLSGFCSEQIVVLLLNWGGDWFGMKNEELGVRYVKYTMNTKTQVAPSVGH